MKRILSYIGVGMLLLSVMTACEEDAALLNPDVGHDKSTVPEETVTSLGYFNSTTLIVPLRREMRSYNL